MTLILAFVHQTAFIYQRRVTCYAAIGWNILGTGSLSSTALPFYIYTLHKVDVNCKGKKSRSKGNTLNSSSCVTLWVYLLSFCFLLCLLPRHPIRLCRYQYVLLIRLFISIDLWDFCLSADGRTTRTRRSPHSTALIYLATEQSPTRVSTSFQFFLLLFRFFPLLFHLRFVSLLFAFLRFICFQNSTRIFTSFILSVTH